MQSEKIFLEMLNIFRNEVESAMRFLYSELTIHTLIAKDKKILNALNASPTFWNTVLSALQHSTFITLGRIFDPKAKSHSIHVLFKYAENNKNIFTKESFSRRWRESSDRTEDNDDRLNEYLKGVHVPTDKEFRDLRKFIAEQKKKYLAIYGPIRHHFGHRIYHKNEDIKSLFDKVQIKDLEKYCVNLKNIHETLWQLFHNGRGPIFPIKQRAYSTPSILKKKYELNHSKPLNAHIIEDVAIAMEIVKLGKLSK